MSSGKAEPDKIIPQDKFSTIIADPAPVSRLDLRGNTFQERVNKMHKVNEDDHKIASVKVQQMVLKGNGT
jgi:hypothetical protein